MIFMDDEKQNGIFIIPSPPHSQYTINNVYIINEVFALFCIWNIIQNKYVSKWCPISLTTLCLSLPAAAPIWDQP